MHRIAVGELRAIIANLPDDAVLEAVTQGDETARLLVLSRAFCVTGVPLEKIDAGETPDEWNERFRDGRYAERSRAEFVHKLLNSLG